MKFITLSFFPDFFEKSLNISLFKKAINNKIVQIENYNIRSWGKKSGKNTIQVDDKPYGGGAGMILMVEPVYKALKELKENNQNLNPKVLIFTPKGQIYNQKLAYDFSKENCLILICPRYEGFDERILKFVDFQISVGNFILSNGDIPALLVIDSISRLLPGFIGNPSALNEESFNSINNDSFIIEYPQYTKPAIFVTDDGKKMKVPKVLLSGHHQKIQNWRQRKTNVIKC